MAKRKAARRTTKAKLSKLQEVTPSKAGTLPDMDSGPGNTAALNSVLEELLKAVVQREHQGEGHVYQYSLRTAPKIRPEDVEATMTAARNGIHTLLRTARSLNVAPEIKAKAGSALVDVLRFFVSSWQERSKQATLNPNFPLLRAENTGFKARCKELYPRAARHDKLGKAVQKFVHGLWFNLSAREAMSAEITAFGRAIPITTTDGKEITGRSFKAFDRWAAQVKCLVGLEEHTWWRLETLVRHARAEHFESYWDMVFMPIAKSKHYEAVKNPDKADPNWREIANHSWRGVIERRAKKTLKDLLMIFKGSKFEGGFIW